MAAIHRQTWLGSRAYENPTLFQWLIALMVKITHTDSSSKYCGYTWYTPYINYPNHIKLYYLFHPWELKRLIFYGPNIDDLMSKFWLSVMCFFTRVQGSIGQNFMSLMFFSTRGPHIFSYNTSHIIIN